MQTISICIYYNHSAPRLASKGQKKAVFIRQLFQ